ncbi:MAG: hypothetical protein H0U75_03400 [Legionella sp.]|nr:hypothetical protein [Legionella sp.]
MFQPGPAHILHLTPGPSVTEALIRVIGSPLVIARNGTGKLTIINTSTLVTATNVRSNFKGTALEGNVTETGNTCAVLFT